MANPKDHITPDLLGYELDELSEDLITRAVRRVTAAAETVSVVRARTRFHIMLGRGATHSLCNAKTPKTPDTEMQCVSEELLQGVCRKCAGRYRTLLSKALQIELTEMAYE